MALLAVLLLAVLLAAAVTLVRLMGSDRARQTMQQAASARAAISRASEASIRQPASVVDVSDGDGDRRSA